MAQAPQFDRRNWPASRVTQDASEPKAVLSPSKIAAGVMLSQHQALIYGSASAPFAHTHALWGLWLYLHPFPHRRHPEVSGPSTVRAGSLLNSREQTQAEGAGLWVS